MQISSVLAIAIAGIVSTAAAQTQTPDVPKAFQEVGTIVGKQGAMNADGSYRINLPRNDVQFTHANGMTVPADLGLATYIALSGNATKAFAVGDVAMLEGEIDGVIDRLRAGKFEIVALHNHMTTEEPRLFFLHFQATGNSKDLATTFRSALDVLGHGATRTVLPKPGKPKIDSDALSAVFNAKPQMFPSGVIRFAKPRSDLKVTVDDQVFSPGMGLGSWAAFYACECGLTLVMGDTCTTRSDLQAVINVLRNAGIHITAIHNHVLGANGDVMFLHYEGEGDAVQLAKGIKACWNALGSK